MQQSPQVADVVSGIIFLLLVAVIVLAITRKLRLPFTVILVLVGIGLAWLSNTHPGFLPALHNLEISSSLILYVFLPTLIFESAFNLDVRELQDNIGSVLALAVPGLLLSTGIIGLIVHFTTSIPLTASLLLGAILSATDPVAVIAIFRRLGAPLRLTVLVEGESLFNDATSVVLSRIILGVVVGGFVSEKIVARGVLDFVLVFIGGLLVGWILGFITAFTISKIENHFIEITLTTILAYVSYLFAEQTLHVSGIMATIAAGLTMGGWGRTKISIPVRDYLEHFWEYIAFVANALIFIMVGLGVNLSALKGTLGELIWVVVALLLSRAAVIYGLMPLVKRLPKAEHLSRAYRVVIFWGGLRGAIALAIVLSLPQFQYRDAFVALVTGAVLFTLIVQGLTIEPLVHKLGLDRLPLADQLVQFEEDFAAKQNALNRLPELLGNGKFVPTIVSRLKSEYEKTLSRIKAEIEDLHQQEIGDDSQKRSLLFLRVLAEEKTFYINLFNKGLLTERALTRLLRALERQTESVNNNEDFEGFKQNYSLSINVEDWGEEFSMAPEKDPGRLSRIAVNYEIATTAMQGSERVLNILDSLARIESTPQLIVEQVRSSYQKEFEAAKKTVNDLVAKYPKIVEKAQERLARQLLQLAETETRS